MAKTYETLFPLVIREIEKRIGEEVAKVDSRYSVQPGGEGGSLDSRAIAEIISTLTEDLGEIIEPRIILGLDATATSPPSKKINITQGIATSHGKKWVLAEDTTIAIPFDSSTYVFFVTIYNHIIEITRTYDSTKCEICRVIVPKPGATYFIVDDKPKDGYDGYIISAKDVVYKETQEFDDASVEKLRDVIGDILADNLIGNIRLSEDLKIINTQGTLELDSSAIKILSIDSKVLAKFNRNGTFFYDDNGIEVAKFSVDGAQVGNIIINKNNLTSNNYVSGSSGFRINDTGYAEFEDVRIRGMLKSSVFEYNTVSAIGGQLIVSNASTLSSDMTAFDSSTLATDSSVFRNQEVILLRDGINVEYLLITDISQAPVYSVTRDLANNYSSDQNPVWKKGAAVASTGIANSGYIILDSTSNYSPFIDINFRNSITYNDWSTKVRLGNLEGINDPYLGQLSGFGLYSDNAYLRGALFALEIKTANSGSRVYMDTSKFIAYDDAENKIFQIYMDTLPGEGDVGDIYFGDYTGANGIFWDASASTLNIRGLLTADDIQTGNLSVSFLTSGTIAGSSIVLGATSYLESADYVAATSGWQLAGDGTITFENKAEIAAHYGDWTTDSDAATITFSMLTSNRHKVTLGGNRTLAVSNVSTGQVFLIKLIQDGSGSRTVTWFSGISWPFATIPTLVPTASKADVFVFICTGTNTYDGFIVGQNL